MRQNYEIIPGNLPLSSWKLIVNALEYYLTEGEQRLIKENAGDTEWTRLDEYEGVRNDILYYVIGVDEESKSLS